MAAVSKHTDDEEVNFGTVVANSGHKLFDGVSHGKVLHFLSTCWFFSP